VACVAGAVALTAPALDGPFVFDDLPTIVRNAEIRDLGAIWRHLFHDVPSNPYIGRNDPLRPLISLLHAMLYALAGPSPRAFHLCGAALHGLAAWATLLLARRLAGRSGASAAASWLVGGIASAAFLVNPFQLGTVMYAYGLSDVLSSLLLLGAIFAYVRRDGPRATAVSTGLMAAALAAKQSAVVLPLVLAALDRLLPAAGPRSSGRAPRWLPHAVLAAVYLVLHAAFFGAIADVQGGRHLWERWTYVWLQPHVVARYLGLTIFPSALAIDHDVLPQDLAPYAIWLPWTLVALALGWLVYRLARPRAGGELVAFALAFYGLILAPTSSFLPTVDLMVERRAYGANFGVFLLLGHSVALVWLAARRAPRPLRAAPLVAAFSWLFGLTVLAERRARTFASAEAIWQETLAAYPEHRRAWSNLGAEYLMTGRYDEARTLLAARAGKAAAPAATDLTNLAATYLVQGPQRDLDEAKRLLDRAIATQAQLPTSFFLRGLIAKEQKSFEQAAADLGRALELDSTDARAAAHLAQLHVMQVTARPDAPDAAVHLSEARRLSELALSLEPMQALALGVRRWLTERLAAAEGIPGKP
jgi:tetratricopeptide (TPR) repeat protein